MQLKIKHHLYIFYFVSNISFYDKYNIYYRYDFYFVVACCGLIQNDFTYCQISNISRTKSQHFKNSYCLAAFFAESLVQCQVDHSDVVGAAPTGDAPTTIEWSTMLMPTKVPLILEVLRFIFQSYFIDNGAMILLPQCWGGNIVK